MKRQLFEVEGYSLYGCSCCPGHDKFPGVAYKSRRSKAARARGKKVEHQHVRSVLKRSLCKEASGLGLAG